MLRPKREKALTSDRGCLVDGDAHAVSELPSPFAVDPDRNQIGEPHEIRDECRSRPLEHLARGPDLLDLARTHHDEAIGNRKRLVLIMRNEDRCQGERFLQQSDLGLHFLSKLGIEIGERLIQKQDNGLDDQRARQGDALLLAARELLGQPVGEVGKTNPAQCRVDPACDLDLAIFRISSPNAPFSATVMCGKRA